VDVPTRAANDAALVRLEHLPTAHDEDPRSARVMTQSDSAGIAGSATDLTRLEYAYGLATLKQVDDV
jgi:hypothetical protein